MSLIFAIDNDMRQSAQLASLLRTQVDADLVQSASATEGLAVLRDRIPDLILTSTFLSPRDEATLAGYLRDLGGRGAHVQTLTIPVLAATDSAPAKGNKKKVGMLGALRREKAVTSLLEGCSPDAFAREVQQYLVRGLERRAMESEPATPGSSPFFLTDPTLAPESASWSLVTPQMPETLIVPLIMEAAAPDAVPLVIETIETPPPTPLAVVVPAAVAAAAETEPAVATERTVAEAVAAEPAAADVAAAERAETAAAAVGAVASEVTQEALAEPAPAEQPDGLAAADAISETGAPGPGDIYIDAPESVAVVDLSPAAETGEAQPVEGCVAVVDMGKAHDLDALSRVLTAGQSLFVPEPFVPEIPAAVFLKDLPALDSSIFVDAPEAVPAAPLVDRPYAGLAFEDIFLSARDRKRMVAVIDAPEQRAIESIDAEIPAAAECGAAEPPADTVTPIEPEAEPVTSEAPGPADTSFSVVETDEPPAEPPAATPEPVPVQAECTSPAWSWMDSDASTPLADIFAAVVRASESRQPLAEEPVAEEFFAGEPVADEAVALAAPTIPEVFNPDAAAGWNAVIAWGSSAAEGSFPEPVAIEEVATAPAPVVGSVLEVRDPVQAAAWRSAMAGHVADVPGRLAVPAAAPETVPVTVRAMAPVVVPVPALPPAPADQDLYTVSPVDEWGGQTGPVLGDEFLALIGNAARQASLDAFDALDEAAGPAPAQALETRQRPSGPRVGRHAPSHKQPRRKKPRPAQDEWGIFDPSQCGPDALFDEEAWEEEPDDRRPSPRRGRSAA